MKRQRFFKPILYVTVALGGVIVLFCLHRLSFRQLDWSFLWLAVATATVASRFSIRIPHVKGEVTIADTIIFLVILLYGGEAAVLVAALDGLCSSFYVSKKLRVLSFNAGQMACSTFLTVCVLRLSFGSILDQGRIARASISIGVICVMALTQYICNSGLVALYTACKTDQPIWATWRKHYLWTSISYLAGASIASVAAKYFERFSIYSLMMIAPIMAIIYFTYKTYLKNVQASTEKAEQARRHIDELSHYIAEQERIREQFSQVEKMSALGELASGVAHDFNNTLAGILGRAQLMLRKTTDPEIERGLNIIIKTAEDGSNTVKRIQDFARQRRDHDFVPLAVDQLLMDVNEITRPRWKDRAQAANVHISLDLQVHSDAWVMGHPSELREVLVNMIFNAVDAMPEGGRLTLSATERKNAVEIAVSDTGIGMSPEVRSRVFDPFFTTKGKAGMGLGLAVCYGIIQRHQGTIEVESEVGKGTAFRLRLPTAAIKPEANVQAEIHSHLTLVPSPHSHRILIVDDEESVRDVLRDVLNAEGYEVSEAANADDALKILNTADFKAIFTDVGMPGMSGWELARAIREQDTKIPIAVITGWGEAVGSVDQQEAKVDWVVTKPFSIDQICDIASEIAQRNRVPTSNLPLAAGAIV